jgi:RNA polymerase sigma-70 factor, ECF subfamily
LLNLDGTEKLTDLDLVELSRNGDQSAFREIVKRHKAKIAATIYGMIGKCDEADDIGQEVFIRFFNTINNFRGDSALSTYLIRIAMNLSLNEINKKKIRKFLSFDSLLENHLDITDDSGTENFSESKEIINAALLKLNSKYRSVIVLRLIDGYSTEETAKILTIPIGTVLSRLARAQSKLKEYLQPYKLDL